MQWPSDVPAVRVPPGGYHGSKGSELGAGLGDTFYLLSFRPHIGDSGFLGVWRLISGLSLVGLWNFQSRRWALQGALQ